ncbi:deoxyribose-phosphate aldolase [Olsenella massiliensis]|uniref:deoxyribose-phosphate aldolase n=1 Tax=Olsenella massiliensis TaxID=1622075 RepID=UPI00071C7C05|nr:deoxyribose-phosphate aldolase [Olsenella massiliensis]
MSYTVKQVAAMVDHTNLHAYATTEDFRKLCDEAKEYGFKSVAINTYPVSLCRGFLEGSEVLTGAAVSFPLGQTTIETKAAEVANAIKDGCQEFDYVLNVGKLLERDYDYIKAEMERLVALGREANVTSKVIFETCYLREEDIIAAAKIASEVKPDFVKTSTGFGTAGATVEHVRLMKEYAGADVQVKAAGGIRSWETAKAMIDAGATRLGTSSGIKIVQEMRAAGLE